MKICRGCGNIVREKDQKCWFCGHIQNDKTDMETSKIMDQKTLNDVQTENEPEDNQTVKKDL